MLLTFCVIAYVHWSPAQDAVCSGGFGSFTARSSTGVTVSVGAKRNLEFAGRTCTANLAWAKQDLLVAPDAWQVDVDAMGIDLGLGSLVIAFQTKGTDLDRLQKYEIYSLKKNPRLLRTIVGGAVSGFVDGGYGQFGDRRCGKGPVGESGRKTREGLDGRHDRLEVYSRLQGRPPVASRLRLGITPLR